MSAPQTAATEHLRAHLAGDPYAVTRLVPLVYAELRAIAAGQMRGERKDHTLQPTALVNEALSRLICAEGLGERGSREFIAIAARTMRRVLIDHARARRSRPRAGGLELTSVAASAEPGLDPIDVLGLHEALGRLGALSERQAQVVELRYFGGLTLREAAQVMGIGYETAKDHWTLARAWLNRELSRGDH